MSWHDAPLYVESHDLGRWVIEKASSWPTDAHLGALVTAAGCDLVTAISLALTFPSRRAEHLYDADRSIVRLRTLLRLAKDLNLISPAGLRFAHGRLRTIGRMVGGWRKRVATTATECKEDRVEIQPSSTQRGWATPAPGA